MKTYYLTSPGERPYWASIATELWGADRDIDSDGNDNEGMLGGWTELTLTLRSDPEHRVDVDPLDTGTPLVLVIKSEIEDLARRTAHFLQKHAGGELSETQPFDRPSDG